MNPRETRCPRCGAAPGELCSIGRNYYGRPAYHAPREWRAIVSDTLTRLDRGDTVTGCYVYASWLEAFDATTYLNVVRRFDSLHGVYAWNPYRHTLTDTATGATIAHPATLADARAAAALDVSERWTVDRRTGIASPPYPDHDYDGARA